MDELIEKYFKRLQKKYPAMAVELSGHYNLLEAAKKLAEKEMGDQHGATNTQRIT